MNIRWLMMMRRWVQNPPSLKQVIFVFAIVAACLLLLLFETLFGWPEMLTPTRPQMPRI